MAKATAKVVRILEVPPHMDVWNPLQYEDGTWYFRDGVLYYKNGGTVYSTSIGSTEFYALPDPPAPKAIPDVPAVPEPVKGVPEEFALKMLAVALHERPALKMVDNTFDRPTIGVQPGGQR